MKLATLRNGTRDGALAIVSRDLSTAVLARNVIADLETFQQLLDEWDEGAPRAERISSELNAAIEKGVRPPFDVFPFDEREAMAPLPRAYQWADGSAYVNHVELVRKARGAEMPQSFWTDPLMYQGGSDTFLGARDPIEVADEAYGIDLEGEVAVITGDVPMAVSRADAEAHIRFVMLVNDVSLRNLIPNELAKGFGFFHGKPSTAFSPVAVTPDELGDAWRNASVHLPLHAAINDTPLGCPDAGVDMTFTFADLIAHAAKTRRLAAGTIIGSGTVSNKGADGGPGTAVSAGGAGYTCLAELRTIETIKAGKPSTPFLKFGDRVRIEMLDRHGASIFGTIEQTVVKHEGY
ncbi:MAG TPA: fumarylacetoacetate hydrolase family protein [Hyphomicrobiaceae bacterium]|nr:fumarylacetoacetate hydrolase family protein [Hyphomicrobiaceae bacterium]